MTGPVQRVTDDAQPEYVAGVSLDGSMLAFSPASRGAWSVRMMDMKTRETRLLVPPGLLEWTILSPDGSRLAFRKNGRSRQRHQRGVHTRRNAGACVRGLRLEYPAGLVER